MSEKTKEMLQIVDMLAQDSDFTKVTKEEKERMDIAKKELENGEVFTHEQVWG